MGVPEIANAACALIVMPREVLGPALSIRPVTSSIPNTVAVIDNAWPIVPVVIVITKSMYPMPRIVFDADAFAVTPGTRPLNDAVTVNAFAFATGLFTSETRTTRL